MSDGTDVIRTRRNETLLVIQVEGGGTMKYGVPIRRLVEKSLAEGVRTIQVDLRTCTYMDSTFLGTLLFIHRVIANQPSAAFALVAPAPECQELFRKMGLRSVCRMIEEPGSGGTWTNLSADDDDPTAAATLRNLAKSTMEQAKRSGG